MTHATYDIQGMHCQSCVSRIETALKQVAGADLVTVSLDPPRAEIDSEERLPTEQIQEALQQAGEYSLRELDQEPAAEKSWLTVYMPLLLVLAFVSGGSVILALRSGSWAATSLMSDFMGQFFVAFAFFKLLTLKGFADAFASYDLIAGRVRHYGPAYPFIELGLGVCYLLRVMPFVTNLATFAVMTVGAIGVAISLLKRNRIRCACLGTVFELPMSTVTLIEDVAMAAMAALMLFEWN